MDMITMRFQDHPRKYVVLNGIQHTKESNDLAYYKLDRDKDDEHA